MKEQEIPKTEGEEPSRSFNIGRFLLDFLWDVVSTVVPAVFIALFINVYVVQATVVDGPSMQPNLYYDYRVVVEKVTYRIQEPHRGDIVVFDAPGEQTRLIKRVVALPGEVIEVQSGEVVINDRALEEAWSTRLGGSSYPPTAVPPGHVFVLGDNRGVSRDSRSFGPVSIDQITGRALFVYWPLDQVKLLR